MSGTTGPTTGGADVGDTIKDFWATRPRRPRRGRKVAGVAAGIANRYRIDPTLVRVGLIVAAIYGGAGIIAYLLGWLFLPEQDDETSPFESLLGRGRSSTSAAFTLLLCGALIAAASWLFNGFLPGYLGLLVVAGLVYLLHRSRGHIRPEPTGTTQAAPMTQSYGGTGFPYAGPTYPAASAPSAAPRPAETTTEPTDQPATEQVRAQVTEQLDEPVTEPVTEQVAAPVPEPAVDRPPAWDPLGAAPFAWDLPDPNPPEPEHETEPPARRSRSRIGLVTVAIALIAAAGMSFGMGGWINAQHIIGVALGVLGLGMVLGSFVRGGRGLVGLAVPLAVVGVGMTVISPDGWHGLGDVDVRPATIDQVSSEYRKTIGSIQLDLTDLPNTGLVDTRVDLGLGDVTVILPAEADVTLSCRTEVGSTSCLGQEWSGIGPDEPVRVIDRADVEPTAPADPPNPPAPPADPATDQKDGLKVYLEIEVGTGSVDVRRG